MVSLPLLERKRLLEQTLAGAPSRVRFAGFLEGEVDAIVAAVCQHNLEGIVAKLATSRYELDKRSGEWVKFKCGYRQEFITIGGDTRGTERPERIRRAHSRLLSPGKAAGCFEGWDGVQQRFYQGDHQSVRTPPAGCQPIRGNSRECRDVLELWPNGC